VEQPDAATIRRIQEAARDRLYSRLESIKETYDANKPSFAAKTAGTSYWCTGTLTLTSVIINTGIKINNIEFNDFSEVLKFKGTSWGLGIGYGTSFATGAFSLKPSTLDGMKVNIELAFAMVGGGAIQTSFWDGGTLIGAMDFVGAGGGGGVFWGDGQFTKA
jgi:hypothetical protein